MLLYWCNIVMKKRTTNGDALTEIILETFQFNGALLAAGNKLTNPYGLTSARWQVMGAIELEKKALTVSQIARRMGITRQAVQRVVNDLARIDMVALEDNLDHKRAPLVSISKTGKVIMKEINIAQIAWVNDLAKDFEDYELTQALNVIRNVRKRIKKSIQDE